MTRHYNSSIVERAQRILNSKQGDYLSDEVSGPFAVIPISPTARIIKQGGGTNSASTTVYTTPSDKDFYLTGASLSIIKDVTSTSVITNLRITIDGVAVPILSVPGITLTPQSECLTVSFSVPIKVDRGTSITINNGTAIATIVTSACIYGYTEETTSS